MSKRRCIALTAFITLLLSFSGYSAPPVRQQSPTGLLMEITYYSGRAPAYLNVPGRAWYALFRRIPSWQPPADSLPVQAVNIISRLEGDSIRVTVSAFVGVRFHEKEAPVATYLVKEDEKITANELKQFGVEPFEIKVVRAAPISTALPQIVNNTESIAVISIVDNNSTLPSYKLSLRNLSNKNVVAMRINVLVDNRVQISSLPHDQDNLPLIKAEAISEHTVSAAKNTKMVSNDYLPDSPPNQTILISTAIFDDGSYEGDAEPAATYWAFQIGRKIQIGKIIPLIQNALNHTDSNISQAIASFKEQVASLTSNAEEEVVSKLHEAFPKLAEKTKAELKTSIEVALNGMKFDLLKSLQAFEKASPQPIDANAFRSWLIKSKERYEKWLSNLQLKG